MAQRTRDSIGNLLFNCAVLARATHPELRLEDGPARNNARRKLGVTVRTVGAPFGDLQATLRAVSFQSWLLVLGAIPDLHEIKIL